MENKNIDEKDSTQMGAMHRGNGLGLPIVAIGLGLLPVIILQIPQTIWWMTSSALLIIILLPIAGLIAGIISLNRCKGQIGYVRKILS
jgi:hypothetical protein